MAIWKNSLMTTVYYDETEANEGEKCEVKIDNKTIVASYGDREGGFTIYEGKNDGTGHFELFCPKRRGRATLHMFKGAKVLEGSWIEEDERGFWKIELFD